MTHNGNLIINAGDETDYSQLTTVGSYLSINSNCKLSNLTTVGRDLSIYSKCDLPNLTTVGGDLYIYCNSDVKAPNLTTVGGYLYINSKCDLPNLTTVGRDLSINSNCDFKALFLEGLKWKSVDGSLFVIESSHTKEDITIHKGYNIKSVSNNIITRETCYVAESGEYYAHGDTMRKAVEDLNFKIISEKLKNEPINEDTIIDIKYYRLVTGACEFGVKSFIETNGLKESYTALELLPILESKHAYGVEKFKTLLTFKQQ